MRNLKKKKHLLCLFVCMCVCPSSSTWLENWCQCCYGDRLRCRALQVQIIHTNWEHEKLNDAAYKVTGYEGVCEMEQTIGSHGGLISEKERWGRELGNGDEILKRLKKWQVGVISVNSKLVQYKNPPQRDLLIVESLQRYGSKCFQPSLTLFT